MPFPLQWETVINEVAGGILLAIIGAAIAFGYRMWVLPGLQAQTILEIRQLRLAIGQLTNALRESTRGERGDHNVSFSHSDDS